MNKLHVRFLSMFLLSMGLVNPIDAMRRNSWPAELMQTEPTDSKRRQGEPTDSKRRQGEPTDSKRRQGEPMDSKRNSELVIPKGINGQNSLANRFLRGNKDQNSTLDYPFGMNNPLRKGYKFTLVHHLEVPKIDCVEIQENMSSEDIGQQIAYLINTLDCLTYQMSQEDVVDLLNNQGHARTNEYDYTLDCGLFIRDARKSISRWESNFEIIASTQGKNILLDCKLGNTEFKLIGESNGVPETDGSYDIWKFRQYGLMVKSPITSQNESTKARLEQEKQLGMLEDHPYLVADREWKLNCALLMLKVLANNQNVENVANLIRLSEGKLKLSTCNGRGFSGFYGHIDLVLNNKNDFMLTLGNPKGEFSYQIHAYRESDKGFWNFEYISR